MDYRKPPTISPGLIYFCKRFLMGLYKGGLIYGWAYTWTIFCVSNKQVRHKQVSHKQGNKRVLSSDYWAYINWGNYIRGAYNSGGLIFGGAYIWNEVSVSTCGGLIHGGGLYSGGLIVGGLRYDILIPHISTCKMQDNTLVKKTALALNGLTFI